MSLDAHQLLGKSQPDLDALFSAHEAGPIPDGEAEDTAIIAPGTPFSPAIAAINNIFAWKGKVFDASADFRATKSCPLNSRRLSPESIRPQAGSTARNALSSTIQRPHWSPSTSGTRSASSILVSTSAKSTGIRSAIRDN